jgi:phosphoribosylanthranilate isomerase
MDKVDFFMRIKICGITRLEDALVCEEAGADAIGFIFVPSSKRFILPVNAARISSGISGLVSRIGVFRDTSLEEILATARQVQLSAVQLHGSETDDFVTRLEQHFPVIRAISYQAGMVFPPAQTLLLDGLEAGSGQVFDWSSVDTSHLINRRWLLAGGLNPENVREAVQQLRPWGVDVSSGVERAAGIKDAGKIRAFIAAAQ